MLLLLSQRIRLLLLQQALLRKRLQLLGREPALHCMNCVAKMVCVSQMNDEMRCGVSTAYTVIRGAALTCDSCCSCAMLRP